MIAEPLTRHVRLKPSPDGRTLTGLAVPFGSPTRIDSPFEGRFDEQFTRGAFKRSLGLRTPKLQFEHGTHPLYGQMPIGEFRSITETKAGLRVEARIFDSELFAPLREAIASDAIDGMSIRFRPLEIEITDPAARDDGGSEELRTVTEAELIELGPVVFPAYADTSVDLRSFDLSDKNDRHRLAEALLGVAVTAGQAPATSQSTEPLVVAGSPARSTDGQEDIHPPAPHHAAMQQRKEFWDRWMSKN